MMEPVVKALFERYADAFNQALRGDPDLTEVASFYAPAFIAASPMGVATGQNDDQLRDAMAQGYARYRAIGTKEMQLRELQITRIDDNHCLARAAWRATYARANLPSCVIDFDVHYLVQVLEGRPSIFGWVAGDEEAALQQHGII